MAVPKLVSSRSIYKDSQIEVKQDVIRLNSFSWNQIYLHWNNKNAVCIIPFENNGVYLVNQYRHASGKSLWQFPGGLMEPNISESALAHKELAEETGFTSDKIVKIGSISPEPGLSTVQVKIYLATQLKAGKKNLEISESTMKLQFFDLKTLEIMIRKGEITCGITLSSYLLFKLHKTKATE